jgi:cytosine/creatinine deaminase
MRRHLILRGGRVLRYRAAELEPLDIRIGGDGRIAEIGASLPQGDAEVLPVDGQLVLPGLVDMHQHLDKSRTRPLLDNPSGTLAGA